MFQDQTGQVSVIAMPVAKGITLSQALSEPGQITVENACSVVDLHVTFMKKWVSPPLAGRKYIFAYQNRYEHEKLFLLILNL